ncbi:WBP11-like protein, partial [Mya arenaria]
MGRRSINTTKSGKFMNPTDQARKEARKRELKKNKKQRMMVRTAVLKGKEPLRLLDEMEIIDQMELNPMEAPKLNEKVLKDKRKKLHETFMRVFKLYEKENPEYAKELHKANVDEPHLLSTSPKKKRAPGPPPGPPPELSDSEPEMDEYTHAAEMAAVLAQEVPSEEMEVDAQSGDKKKKIRFIDDESIDPDEEEKDTRLKFKPPKAKVTSLQKRMLEMAGQDIPKIASDSDNSGSSSSSDSDDDDEDRDYRRRRRQEKRERRDKEEDSDSSSESEEETFASHRDESMPPPRMVRPQSGPPSMLASLPLPPGVAPPSLQNPNVISAQPSIMKLPQKAPSEQKKDAATISAKPQIKNPIGDVTRFMPTSLKVKRSAKE